MAVIMAVMLNASQPGQSPDDAASTPDVPDGEGAGPVVFDDLAVAPPPSQSRQVLLRRLADVVCLPESRINAFERAVTADLLVEMLREAEPSERARVAKRLSILNELPNSLVRLLLIDEPDIARPLIEEGEALSDSDLYYCARNGKQAHRQLLAARKGLSSFLSEVLVEYEETPVIELLLRNLNATFSQQAIETVVAMSQAHPAYIPLLMRRPELRPSSAYVLFWWSPAEVRKTVLSRFGVNREIMQDMASDVFAMAAKEKWQDAMSRKALQFIERRQRNREALKKSPYDSLEAAIADAAQQGMTRKMAEEIAYMSGIKPSTGAKILRDAGGEGLAVLCKATGCSRKALKALWKALRRPLRGPDGQIDPQLAQVLIVYDMLAVDRAQTVLRYWNWSLSSALTHVMLKSLARGEEVDLDSLSVPQRAAWLAFAQDLKG